MAEIEQLIDQNKLDIKMVTEFLSDKILPVDFKYDTSYDSISLYFVKDCSDTALMYITKTVSYIFKISDLKVIGIRLDNFEKYYVKRNLAFNKFWSLYNHQGKFTSMGEIQEYYEQSMIDVTPEFRKVGKEVYSSKALAFSPA